MSKYKFNNNKLPLVEFTTSLYPEISLENTCVIAVQHLLKSTHMMFRSWIDKGLKAENIHVLGKCYSTSLSVLNSMISEGIKVSPLSISFNSHQDYDTQFDEKVSKFLTEIFKNQNVENFQRIILFDDGGKLLKAFQENYPHLSIKSAAVEQTSSGYEKIKDGTLLFPVVNVARAPVKLIYECPMIADVAASCLIRRVEAWQSQLQTVLIIGRGAIGSAIETVLKKRHEVLTYDKLDAKNTSLEQIIPHADLIVGCTGTTSLRKQMHPLIKRGAMLMSVSSSDVEFDSVHIRKHIEPFSNCHRDIHTEALTLLNSGFPVNFDGQEHSVAPEKIQLIRSLLTLGLFQAVNLIGEQGGLVDLDNHKQNVILNKFTEHSL